MTARFNVTPRAWAVCRWTFRARVLAPAFAIRPVAASAIATAHEIPDTRDTAPAGKIASCIARQVTAYVAYASLHVQIGTPVTAMAAAMRHTTPVGTLFDQCQPTEDTMAAYRPVAECRV